SGVRHVRYSVHGGRRPRRGQRRTSGEVRSMTITIRARDRDAVIQSLRAGVVPRMGQHLVQVGRTREVETLLSDVERVRDGGSAFRVIVGEYGAGKTFFLNLVRAIAMEKKLVVASADLNPDRRLHATGGQARSLYAELM